MAAAAACPGGDDEAAEAKAAAEHAVCSVTVEGPGIYLSAQRVIAVAAPEPTIYAKLPI